MHSNAVHVECTCICMQPYTLGNRTFASVKGPEEYDFLKISFQPVWKQLGDLIADLLCMWRVKRSTSRLCLDLTTRFVSGHSIAVYT